MAKSYSVTSAGVNPAEDRAHRMRMYFIAMSLRVACVTSLFWVRGWWVLLAAAGAVFLPWFAVMVGNAVAHDGGQAPDAPEPLKLEGGAPVGPEEVSADTLIVIDVEPERRSSAAEGAGPAGAAQGPAGGSSSSDGASAESTSADGPRAEGAPSPGPETHDARGGAA
ncbi:DUF3099 domain-containing protein [Leucobacter muris]|uniref:DUF3099 domain-containing protein n=1 Tax=Leucobacter muris TaxID=1935379 RepID=A0ABX5QFP5_9MICO|nr:DUF3099 domain-containing protein [Leucobacter muris]QAB17912.1 DUF3099 domain-containing protein [Leucobacter muris]